MPEPTDPLEEFDFPLGPHGDTSDLGKKPLVELPLMCRKHDARVIHRLRIPESGPWRVALITMQMLLFRAALCDERIAKRAESEVKNMTLILAEIGCPACDRPHDFNRAMTVLRKGLEYAGRVAKGDVFDAYFGIPANPPTPEA